jgi:hypothetical protein
MAQALTITPLQQQITATVKGNRHLDIIYQDNIV